MKYILVLQDVDRQVELTKPTNWNSVIAAKELCRGFEYDGRKKLSIKLFPKRKVKSGILKD